MGFFAFMNSLLNPTPNTGLLLDSAERLAELPRHELFAGGMGVGAPNWKQFIPQFRYQGPTMFCTGFTGANIASTFEKKETGKDILFSPIELFYRSGGTMGGNYLLNVARAMRSSVVLESDLPTRLPDRWDQKTFDDWKARYSASPDAIKRGMAFSTKSEAIVGTDDASLRSALQISPLSIAIGIGKDYFASVAPRQTSYSAYHNVELLELAPDGSRIIFDSLRQSMGFNGIHTLAPDYEVLYALSFIDLPDDWQGIQTQKITEWNQGALNHYGLSRTLKFEQYVATHFSATLKNHPSLAGLAGRDWLVIVNALSYGGYTETDILNHLTNIRRTGKPIFDLNVPRKK